MLLETKLQELGAMTYGFIQYCGFEVHKQTMINVLLKYHHRGHQEDPLAVSGAKIGSAV